MDSTPPVIFKRSKAKPAPRARQPSPENVENITKENASEAAEDSPITLASKLKNKAKKTKLKSRLSFGGDDDEGDEEEVFKVKKTSLSRRMAQGTHPAIIPPTLDQATISVNEGPKYDAAYLQELKASTPSVRPPRPVDVDPYDANMSIDIGDTSIQTIDMDIEESPTYIPAESSIKVAKEKRERLRSARASGEEDFISLSVSKREDFSQGPHPESRLMREEDELGEGDDEFAEYTSAQERIALGKKSRKLEASQRRTAMKELIDDAEEEDEETAEWEQEQLRRGGHRTPDSSSSKAKQVYKAAPIPPAAPIPSLGPALSRLSDRLAQLTVSHVKNSATLSSLAQERQEVESREVEMRELVEKAEEKRAWFSSFKDWTESVAGFLDEKYPLLEKQEEEYFSLLKERFDMISKRRKEDNDDDLATFIGPLPDAPSTQLEETDDHGRAIPATSPLVQRRERRVARTARRQLRSALRPKEEEEGYSTDSSMAPHDISAYAEAHQSLTSRTKDILADVKAAEFKDPGKGRWGIWREKYSDSYVGAWGGLGVVSVWEFWVRLECVGWDCIEDERSLHSFKWYKGLYEYSRPGEGNVVEERELGPDGDLVASMISTAIIPYVCKVIDNGGLDVYSSKHMRRIIDLSEEIEASLDSGSAKFQNILKSVVTAFQRAVSDLEESVTKYTTSHQRLPGFNPDSIPSRRRLLNRYTKLVMNMVRWRKHAKERFGIGALITRHVENCIIVVARTGWDVGGEEIARKVVKILPSELVPNQLSRLS